MDAIALAHEARRARAMAENEHWRRLAAEVNARERRIAEANSTPRGIGGELRHEAELAKRRRLWRELDAEVRQPLIPGQPEHLTALAVVQQVQRVERRARRERKASETKETP